LWTLWVGGIIKAFHTEFAEKFEMIGATMSVISIIHIAIWILYIPIGFSQS
jgi:hypothetical protein